MQRVEWKMFGIGLLGAVLIMAVYGEAKAGSPPRYWGRNTHGSFLPQRPVVWSRPVHCVPRPIYITPRSAYSYYRPVYCAPRPIYIAPRPTYYPRPVMYQSSPVVYQPAPVITETRVAVAPPIEQKLCLPEGFAETGRRYHSHGSDAGTIDWVKGVLNGERVKITFNQDGTVNEID